MDLFLLALPTEVMSRRKPFKLEGCVSCDVLPKSPSCFNKGMLREWKKWMDSGLIFWLRHYSSVTSRKPLKHSAPLCETGNKCNGRWHWFHTTIFFYPIVQEKSSFHNNFYISGFLEGWLKTTNTLQLQYTSPPTVTRARRPKEDVKTQKSAKENFLPDSRLSQWTDCTKHSVL